MLILGISPFFFEGGVAAWGLSLGTPDLCSGIRNL